MSQSNTQRGRGKNHMVKLLSLLLAMLFLASCGGGTTSIGASEQNALFVNQQIGDDKNSGSLTSPLKTLTTAIEKSKKDSRSIYISAGEYSVKSGEIFPLVIPENVGVFKYQDTDDNNISSDVVILGSGLSDLSSNPVAFIMNGASKLYNLTINPEGGVGVISRSGVNEIFGNKITNGIVGISIKNKATTKIFSSRVTNNSHAAIEIGGESLAIVIHSDISNNNVGFILTESGMLKTNDGGKSGASFVGSNNKCDFYTESSNSLDLSAFIWDNDPFEFNIDLECKNGSNLVNGGTGSVDYQFIPDESGSLFRANKIIKTFSPEFGETIYSTKPSMSFTGYNNKLVMNAVWKEMPRVVDNKIVNIEDIVWFWHSGMQNSPIGYVTYESGKYPKDGNLNPKDVSTLEPAPPLEKGRAYYWAVWEWDDSGVKIDASSSISYFKVARF